MDDMDDIDIVVASVWDEVAGGRHQGMLGRCLACVTEVGQMLLSLILCCERFWDVLGGSA